MRAAGDDTTGPEPTGGEVSLVFVHGTWGRGFFPRPYRPDRPRWFEPGSPFREELISALLAGGNRIVATDAIEWSGANAFVHRDRAALVLAQHLDALGATHPGVTRLVIGHSHGGNVCLRAFAHLQAPVNGIRVATLATPFVELLPGSFEARTPSMLIAPVAIAALALWLYERTRGGEPLSFFLLVALSLISAPLVGLPLARIVSRRFKGLAHRTGQGSSQAAYRAAHPPTLVLRGFDDEASLTLGMGTIAARLSHVSTAATIGFAKIAYRTFTTGSLLLGLFGLVFATVEDRVWGLVATYVALPLIRLLPLVVALVGGFALLEGLAPVVFGRELFLTYLGLEVNSNSSPDAGDHVTTITLAPDTAMTGLRHALYAHPDCAGQIAAWLAASASVNGRSAGYGST